MMKNDGKQEDEEQHRKEEEEDEQGNDKQDVMMTRSMKYMTQYFLKHEDGHDDKQGDDCANKQQIKKLQECRRQEKKNDNKRKTRDNQK
jgi:hypothetical protein